MISSNFARIRNAKPLLLTEEKRVLHFPATNKVRIDNNVNYEPRYRKFAEKYSRQEYENAKKASELGVVPKVQNYRERGNLHSYTQDYGGKELPERLEGMTSKEQYKLGSQVGRIQNKLLGIGLGHTDLHEGNIVRPNPKKSKVNLIDNDAIKNIKDDYDKSMMKSYYMPEAFTTGYNSRINFTHRTMEHFANFNLAAGVDAIKKVGSKVGGLNSVRIGAGVGAAAGLAKGAGVGESEEEKANTTALGRVGKLVGNTAVGGAVGGAVGMATGDVAKGLKRQYKKSAAELTSNNSYGYHPNADFAFSNPLPSMIDKARPYLNNIKAAGGAVGDTAKAFGATRGVQIGGGIGAAVGLAKGAGIGESEEEKANTTGLGRLGKLVGNTAAGGVVGGGLGFAGQNAGRIVNSQYRHRKLYQSIDDLDKGLSNYS